MTANLNFDVIVVGAGSTGLLAAIGLSRLGLRIALCGEDAPVVSDAQQSRTAALLAPSVELLQSMATWRQLADKATSIDAIRIVDDTMRWPRAPEVLFTARELGHESLGWNVANADITTGLWRTIHDDGACHVISGALVTDIRIGDDCSTVALDSGEHYSAKMIVGADGRNSICRRLMDVKVSQKVLDQAAITCVFDHSRPHSHISTEFHRRAGPFTTVPLTGKRSSLVWVESLVEAQRIVECEHQAAFISKLETRLQGLLGAVHHVTGLQMFPLTSLSTHKMAAHRIALVGEAAHVFPPIGAQGLNLGFRDVSTLIRLAEQATDEPGKLGSEEMLGAYDRERQFDVRTRSAGVNFMNNMLLSSQWPTHLARGAALHAINHLPLLKRQIMRLGMGTAPPSQPRS
ncbi:MAG: FAD-dependent oxidoreductase [Pseudomonadota bacterium]